MVDGLLSLVPAAKVGHIGMYRDEETLQPVEYLVKLPEDIDQRPNFVVDPMLATVVQQSWLTHLKNVAHQISICLPCICSRRCKAFQEAHPDVDLYSSLDERLNEHGYIVPGLGNAGDPCSVRNKIEKKIDLEKNFLFVKGGVEFCFCLMKTNKI